MLIIKDDYCIMIEFFFWKPRTQHREKFESVHHINGFYQFKLSYIQGAGIVLWWNILSLINELLFNGALKKYSTKTSTLISWK